MSNSENTDTTCQEIRIATNLSGAVLAKGLVNSTVKRDLT